ncbi:hypothetical protein AS156_40115 [Bradyrhizobium macuxiense]|uniref:Uncharacterized protein n=1 Tax=Bradyrhizobium macuxiense TaxID=1755647 RepID=A0A120FPN8_9BRAD|nr:hypothetical protein [Bradyrhizobium macuxiense]KWV57261.1 hypothetical protein AS156_40115 [Bradyrhizobium macuxiense]
MVDTGNIFRVRCVDNTLQRDMLTVGQIYEVTKVHEKDDYYELSGLGRFSRSRFEIVEPASADDDDVGEDEKK